MSGIRIFGLRPYFPRSMARRQIHWPYVKSLSVSRRRCIVWQQKEPTTTGDTMKNNRKSFLKLLSLVFLLLSFAATPALAGRYELIKGKGVEVCEAYKKNLDRYAALPRFLACGGRFYQFNKEGIVEPNWKQLDFKKRFALYEKAQIYHIRIVTEDYSWPKEEVDRHRKLIKDQANRPNIQIWLAKFDLDGDGTPENVFMTKELTGCFSFENISSEVKERYLIESRKLGIDPEHLVKEGAGGHFVYVLNEALTDIDVAKHERIFGRDGGRGLNVFFFKGISYAETFTANFKSEFFGRGTFFVMSTENVTQPSICEINYQPETGITK